MWADDGEAEKQGEVEEQGEEQVEKRRKISQQGLLEKPQWVLFQGEETPVRLDRLSFRQEIQLEQGTRFSYVAAPDGLSEETLILANALPSRFWVMFLIKGPLMTFLQVML